MPSPRTLRIVSWNVENLVPALSHMHDSGRRTTRGAVDLEHVMDRLDRPDVLCLQEVRVRPRDADLVAAMHRALDGYECHAALCDDPKNGRFRGGRAYGVATYVRRTLGAAALPRPSWDREGRVVAVDLPALKLAILNVYAVNGTDRPHYDHELERIDGDRHGFKRRFQADLLSYARALSDARELVLTGDWNVSRSAIDIHPRLRMAAPHVLARAMFNDTFLPALDVVDCFRALHPEERAYTWFERNMPEGRLDAARVDYTLVSRSLLSLVQRASIYEAPGYLFHSDHVPVETVLAADSDAGLDLTE